MTTWEKEYEILCERLEKKSVNLEDIKKRLKSQVIELPSWAVGNSGTRYGTFRD